MYNQNTNRLDYWLCFVRLTRDFPQHHRLSLRNQICDEMSHIFEDNGETEENNYAELMRNVHPKDRVVLQRIIRFTN
jgi:hypothetical protein